MITFVVVYIIIAILIMIWMHTKVFVCLKYKWINLGRHDTIFIISALWIPVLLALFIAFIYLLTRPEHKE